MGTSSSTLITFEGPHLQKKVRFHHIVTPVFRYKHKMLVGSCCRAFGHKVDLCPNTKEAGCSKCQQVGHPPVTCAATQPKCRNCEGAHLATDSTCLSRLKANASAYRRLRQYAKNIRKSTKPARGRKKRSGKNSLNCLPPLRLQENTGNHTRFPKETNWWT